MSTRDRIALVTGGNRGIGLEVVKQLAGRGWRVLLGARDAKAGAEAVQSLGLPSVELLPLDIADGASVAAAAAAAAGQVPHLDALVNNAAILQDDHVSVLEGDPAVYLRTFDTNVVGTLRVTQAFLPLLLKSPGARIINVSSTAGQLSTMEHWAPAYSISKTALNALTMQLAAALTEKKIAVNTISPGWVRTEMGGPDAPRGVEEGADVIVWLADEAAQSISGKFLRDRKVTDW